MNLSEEKIDEPELLAAAINGSAEAFSDLFNNYYPMIYAFAYRLTLCRHDAEDIAQEAFIKAARSLAGFRREASFKNWLYQIAANTARDRFRRQNRHASFNVPLNDDHAEYPAGSEPDHSPLHNALTSLSDDLRQTLTLVYYENLSHAEAAQILGCAETTVSWRIFRAKRQLKKQLTRKSQELP